MSTVRWVMRARDKVGMVREILEVLADSGANIVSMEVSPGVVHLGFETPILVEESTIRNALLENPDIQDISPVDALPYEKREKQSRPSWTPLAKGYWP